jgi:hypothetical protein
MKPWIAETLSTAVAVSLLLLVVSTPAAPQDELLGHWALDGDAQDSSSGGNHGINHGAELGAVGRPGRPDRSARFDGRDDFINVPSSPSLNVGTGEFSITAWVQTDEALDDVVGDVLSKFDPQRRRGFQLTVCNNVGVTNSQANYRHVHFGIDNGQLEPTWTDHGRLGNAVYVFSLAAFDGNLYASTCESGRDESGRVFRLDPTGQWTDCGSPDKCNAISALAAYDGRLYAASCRYRLRGSSLKESENPHSGGRVFRYEGGTEWTDCGKLGEAEAIFGLVVYKGSLYGSAMYSPGLFRYDGDRTWTDCGSPDGKRVEALAVYNGAIYATGFDEAAVYRYDGSGWEHLGVLGDNTQTYGFAVYQGSLHVTSWPTARVYRFGGPQQWIDTGRLGMELESMPLAVYNGKLYSGSLPRGEVFRYDEPAWSSIGRVDETPDVKYRRAWSMAVYGGRLYIGALPSGRVKSIAAGRSATCDSALAPGWRHLAAVKESGRLKLYIDGRLRATSAAFDPVDYDLSNDRPLRIGFGQHDSFNGRISDVRLIGRALTAGEVRRLAD